jgi:hypothetical protein
MKWKHCPEYETGMVTIPHDVSATSGMLALVRL